MLEPVKPALMVLPLACRNIFRLPVPETKGMLFATGNAGGATGASGGATGASGGANGATTKVSDCASLFSSNPSSLSSAIIDTITSSRMLSP